MPSQLFGLMWSLSQQIKVALAPSPFETTVVHLGSNLGYDIGWVYQEIVRLFGPDEQRDRLEKSELCQSLPLPPDICQHIHSYIWAEEDWLAKDGLQRPRVEFAPTSAVSARKRLMKMNITDSIPRQQVLRQIARFEFGCLPNETPTPIPTTNIILHQFFAGDRLARKALNVGPQHASFSFMLRCSGKVTYRGIRVPHETTVRHLIEKLNRSGVSTQEIKIGCVRIDRVRYQRIQDTLPIRDIFEVRNAAYFTPAALSPARNIRCPSLLLRCADEWVVVELLNVAPPASEIKLYKRHIPRWGYKK